MTADRAPRALAAAALAAALCQAPLASACTNERMHLLTVQNNEVASVGMVGHIDGGTTKLDGGSFRAELVVSAQLQADIAASLAGGCEQWVHHGGSGVIILMGNANASYDAKTSLLRIDAATGAKDKLAGTWHDHASGDTGGTLNYPHEALLKKKVVKALVAGDLVRLTGKATAIGEMIGDTVFDQLAVQYGWSGLTPYLSIWVP